MAIHSKGKSLIRGNPRTAPAPAPSAATAEARTSGAGTRAARAPRKAGGSPATPSARGLGARPPILGARRQAVHVQDAVAVHEQLLRPGLRVRHQAGVPDNLGSRFCGGSGPKVCETLGRGWPEHHLLRRHASPRQAVKAAAATISRLVALSSVLVRWRLALRAKQCANARAPPFRIHASRCAEPRASGAPWHLR